MRYEINAETFEVLIFAPNETIPYWAQPSYPNGDTFDSIEEATEWAELAIVSQQDALAPYPPDGKGLVGKPKVDMSKRREVLAKLNLTEEEAKTLLW